jgi:hypothetical protein
MYISGLILEAQKPIISVIKNVSIENTSKKVIKIIANHFRK